MSKPLCFVLMPFGTKPGVAGLGIQFDAVYKQLIAPAIVAAGMEPLRADEEQAGGIIHKPMFERLILCEYAVADLTNANANVFYELGLRHGIRPASTVLVFAKDQERLPFDVTPLRGFPYLLGPDGAPKDPAGDIPKITALLIAAKQRPTDSPVFQLVEGMAAPDLKHLKTDSFRDRVEYSARKKEELAAARRLKGKAAIEALAQIEGSLGDVADAEAGVVVDLLLSYRAVKAWPNMEALVGKMSDPLAATVLVREQRAFALNRDGRADEAEKVLLDLIQERGPSSETYGLLGRIYKDRWEAESKAGRGLAAKGFLTKAIEAYLKGFEADSRDAYPGINAVTLMELRNPPDPRREALIPVVRYAVDRRIASGKPDYWDHATRLELAVLAKDEGAAVEAATNALASVREVWEPETTLRNLRLIREAREARQETTPWAKEIEEALETRMKELAG